MYVLNGREVSEADFLADELAFESGTRCYPRPVYRNGYWMGWAVYKDGEAVGKIYEPHQYKLVVQLMEQINSGELS